MALYQILGSRNDKSIILDTSQSPSRPRSPAPIFNGPSTSSTTQQLQASKSAFLMGLLWRWCRFQSTLGIILTVFFWTFVCIQFLPKAANNQPTMELAKESKSISLFIDLPPEVDTETKFEVQRTPFPDYHFVSIETSYTEEGRKVKKFQVVDKANQDKPLTFGEFLAKLESNMEFLDDFTDVLRRGLQSFSDMDMSPYFFETPPVTIDSLNYTTFEFVLLAAREFINADPQPGYFDKYFKKCSNGVVSFPNLGHDAVLVVPCKHNLDMLDVYTHLANFIRMGRDDQIRSFLLETTQQMRRRLVEKKGKKVYLSTCGLGIFWLHMRLDSAPKYYTYAPYKIL